MTDRPATRVERAVREYMLVVPPDLARSEEYRVVGRRGQSYRVDPEAGRCSCPDHRYRGRPCKHLLRVLVAEGRTRVAATLRDDADPLLGTLCDGPRWIRPRERRPTGPEATAPDGESSTSAGSGTRTGREADGDGPGPDRRSEVTAS